MLTRWDPFSDMSRLQDEVNGWLGSNGRRFGFTPAVDIFEEKDAIVVCAELPGMTTKDVTVDVENNILTLKGERKFERKFENDTKRDGYHRVERAYGTFSRSFALTNVVEPDKIQAEMKDGVLTVRIPKRAEVLARKIEIKG